MGNLRNEYYTYIKEQVTIKDICDKLGIVTKSVGDDYVCSCIYHNDPNPSMHIYTKTRSFYCFECQRSGNIFTILEKKLGCSFYESIQWIEETYPRILEEKPEYKKNSFVKQSKSGYDIAYDVYKNMHNTELVKLQEFAKERGYNPKYLQEREVFFSKGKKLHNTYVKKADQYIEEMELLKQELLIKPLPLGRGHIDVHYDDYCKDNRIIITIRDDRGRIVGFAGRSTDEKRKPKYLFSNNLPKSQILYRLDSVKEKLARRTNAKLYIVEGVFDALRLESMDKLAVAVLGSHIVENQIKLLEKVADSTKKMFSLELFLDSDEAGLKGTVGSIKNIWKSNILNRYYLSVSLPKIESKDPDEIYKNSKRGLVVSYSAFEFLLRFYLAEEGERLVDIELEKRFEEISVENRIWVLHNIEDMLPQKKWVELFECYDSVMNRQKDDAVISNEEFAYLTIRQFIIGSHNSKGKVVEQKAGKIISDNTEVKDYRYRMQTALQIARTSYEREELTLDESTWERIALGADVVFAYLYEGLSKQTHIRIPMISMQVPKKKGVQRRKELCCHEELVQQQYVLNELLTAGQNEDFEKNIPAVRYKKEKGIYQTGYEYMDAGNEVVSFAYQIDMSAIDGKTEINAGMYRPFYDCWKAYINYIQDGIEKLDGEVVYRVKLDIQGFYDSIRKFVIRDALYPSILQAMRSDESKFQCFGKKEELNNYRSENLMNWILEELYKTTYYDSEDGALKQKVDYDCGIPQGPNLSSYAANVALFSLDKKVQNIVRRANEGCGENKINARYARYVDDMIIIASSPQLLLEIKAAIESHLYDLQLNLSPKTEDADGISKEEANEWTLEERGGFGVSSGFDMPEDTVSSLMEEYESYEVTDRRGALKLLQSNLYTLLYEGIEKENTDFNTLMNVFFQTEEIRYQDIIRFSEMMIFYAAKKQGGLVDEFQKMWQCGLEKSQYDALFMEQGLDSLVLLEGCCRILKRQKQFKNRETSEVWFEVAEKIKEDWWAILDILRLRISQCDILKMNRWGIELKILEMQAMLGKNREKNIEHNKQLENEYWCRWKWNSETTISKLKEEMPKIVGDGDSLLQDFQFCTAFFLRMGGQDDYREIRSKFKNQRPDYKKENAGDNAIITCFGIWFFDIDAEQQKKEDALRVLLNTIPTECRAEIVYNISHLNKYLFWDKEQEKDKEKEVLPVYPGLRYPGIMTMCKRKNTIHGIRRVDFDESYEQKVLNADSWMFVETDKDDKRKKYKKNVQEVQETAKEIKYVQLGEYCYNANKTTAIDCLKKIAEIYLMLSSELGKVNEQLERDGGKRKLVLSKKNVLVAQNISTNKIVDINIENAYLISSSVTTDVVAMEKGIEKYELQTVHGNGAAYWISGYLLKDACHIEEMNLNATAKTDKNYKDVEMLNYSIARLCGASAKRNMYKSNMEHSYQKTIERAIALIKLYLEKEEQRELCLENAKIVNSFIAKKMENDPSQIFDAGIFCCIWAKNYLRFGYIRLLDQLEEKNIKVSEYKTERRVPKLYSYLADGVYQLALMEKEFSGLRLLSAGLYADGILMHLRMQVLECIYSFDTEQRKQFIEEAQMSDVSFPLQELGLDEDTLFIIKEDLCEVYINLLKLERVEKRICYLTHFGWLVLLAKVCEIDKESGFIVGNDYRKVIPRDKIKKELINVCNILQFKKTEGEDSKMNYPFEKMEEMFDVWTRAKVHEILECLNRVDEYYGIEVVKEESVYYKQLVQKKRVRIETETDRFEELPYFCTYGKKNKNICDVEYNPEDEEKKVYTLAKIRGKVVGVSTIDQEFGKLLQKWEDNETLEKMQSVIAEKKESLEVHIVDEKSTELYNGRAKRESEEEEQELLIEIEQFHDKAWENRANTKVFSNADRIALFQFRIDSTYCHPESERCQAKKVHEKNGGKSTEEADREMVAEEDSCAEFRRRKLLEKVMKTCHKFGVEILLLPEYSMRPETVEWMRKQMQENKEYTFSVWAGTYRIPVGYQFSDGQVLDNINLNSKNYWHSAPLPVIMKNAEGETEVLMKKFKKYPAVTLHEDINPTPAYHCTENFSPIMHQYARYAQEKQRKCIMPYFYDARDDVIELICAETFAMASVCNYPSFLKESLEAYIKYKNSKLLENEAAYERYRDKMLKDMQKFGTYTALYQKEYKYLRTPILLIPACTTRTVDYYVFGQGFYLSAGLKTVLCNAVGTGGRGGSCFIGQGSWDNKKVTKNEYLMETTIYHGLKPGIYMQTSEYKDRGALGEKEQALLICDVYPEYDKGQPNAESMLNALSIVAHIPVFEERVLGEACDKFDKCRYFSTYEKQMLEERRRETEKELRCIMKHCKDVTEHYDVCDGVDIQEERPSKTTLLTYDDNLKDKWEVLKAMTNLGKKYKSEWFVRRAEYYEKYYKMYPQAWQPPTLTDWLYVEINYQEFMDNPGDYRIQMPKKGEDNIS